MKEAPGPPWVIAHASNGNRDPRCHRAHSFRGRYSAKIPKSHGLPQSKLPRPLAAEIGASLFVCHPDRENRFPGCWKRYEGRAGVRVGYRAGTRQPVFPNCSTPPCRLSGTKRQITRRKRPLFRGERASGAMVTLSSLLPLLPLIVLFFLVVFF